MASVIIVGIFFLHFWLEILNVKISLIISFFTLTTTVMDNCNYDVTSLFACQKITCRFSFKLLEAYGVFKIMGFLFFWLNTSWGLTNKRLILLMTHAFRVTQLITYIIIKCKCASGNSVVILTLSGPEEVVMKMIFQKKVITSRIIVLSSYFLVTPCILKMNFRCIYCYCYWGA